MFSHAVLLDNEIEIEVNKKQVAKYYKNTANIDLEYSVTRFQIRIIMNHSFFSKCVHSLCGF